MKICLKTGLCSVRLRWKIRNLRPLFVIGLDLTRRKLWCHSTSAAEEVRGLCSPVRSPPFISRSCSGPSGVLPGASEAEPGSKQHADHHEAAGVADSTHGGKFKLSYLKDWRQRHCSCVILIVLSYPLFGGFRVVFFFKMVRVLEML